MLAHVLPPRRDQRGVSQQESDGRITAAERQASEAAEADHLTPTRYRLVDVGLSNFREPEGPQHNQCFSNEGFSVSCGGSSWLVFHHLLDSFLHFFGCRFRLVRTDHPCVAVWIYDSAATLSTFST
jgi:hypothetical protein